MQSAPRQALTPRLTPGTTARSGGGSSRLLIAGCAVVACALFARPVHAQYSEYTLGPNGEWVQTAAADPDSPQAVIAQARRHLAEDRPQQANTLLSNWVRQYERVGGEISNYLPEALQLRGDALTALGDEYEALYDYERVIKEFPGSTAFVTSIERELDIGVRYVNGYRRKFFGARILDASDIGEELLIRVQERMPGSRLGERAGIELADHYYRERDLNLAAEAYDLFLKNYPGSQYHMKAMQRRVYATIARYKGPRYDGAALLDSAILIRRFRNLYPAQAAQAGLDEALLARIDESAGAEMYESARWYISQGDEAAARYILNRLVRERPKTAAAGDAYAFLQDRKWLTGTNAPAAMPESAKQSPTLGDGLAEPVAPSEPISPAPATENQPSEPAAPAPETKE